MPADIQWLYGRPTEDERARAVRAVDRAYDSFAVGRVELGRSPDGMLDVRSATSPSGGAYRPGDKFNIRPHDHSADVKRELRAEGFKIVGDHGAPS